MRHLPSLKTATDPFLKGRFSLTIFIALVHVGHIVEPTPSFLLNFSLNPVVFSVYVPTPMYDLMIS